MTLEDQDKQQPPPAESQTEERKAYLDRQSDVDYDANGGSRLPRDQACSTCRWFKERGDFDGSRYACQRVENYPLAIVSNGWCNKWEAIPSYVTDPEPLEVVIVEMEGDSYTMTMGIDKGEQPDRTVVTKVDTKTGKSRFQLLGAKGIYNALSDLFSRKGKTEEEQLPALDASGFKALGNGYWFAAFTNNFKDRDQEYLANEAHEKYVKRVQMGLVDLPELWMCHIPGTRHGKALYVDKTDHTVFAIGRFDDTPLGKLMEKAYLSAEPGSYGLSHGFRYPAWAKKDKVYLDYNSFEISVLQPRHVSNPYTPFSAIQTGKELEIMPLSEDQKNKLRATYPGKLGDSILSHLATVETGERQIKDLIGTDYKDFADLSAQQNEADKGADAANGGDTLDAIKALVPDIMTGQGELMTLVLAMDKSLKQTRAEMDTMKAALNLKPEAASSSDKTDLELKAKLDAMTEAEKKELLKAKEELKLKKGSSSLEAIFPGLFNQTS